MASAFSVASSVGVEVLAGHGVYAGGFYIVLGYAGLQGDPGVGFGEVEEVFSWRCRCGQLFYFFLGEEWGKGFDYVFSHFEGFRSYTWAYAQPDILWAASIPCLHFFYHFPHNVPGAAPPSPMGQPYDPLHGIAEKKGAYNPQTAG